MLITDQCSPLHNNKYTQRKCKTLLYNKPPWQRRGDKSDDPLRIEPVSPGGECDQATQHAATLDQTLQPAQCQVFFSIFGVFFNSTCFPRLQPRRQTRPPCRHPRRSTSTCTPRSPPRCPPPQPCTQPPPPHPTPCPWER